MKSAVLKALFCHLVGISVLFFIPCIILADFSVGGEWDVTDSHWCGPLVVDIDGDGEEEIIITDATTIRIYSPDSEGENPDPIATIDLDDIGDLVAEGYRFRSIPSVGQLNETDNLEIVACCVNNVGDHDYIEVDCPRCHGDYFCDYYSDLSRLLIWEYVDGEGANLLDQTGVFGIDHYTSENVAERIYITAMTPTLVDLEALEGEGYEDNIMEIVITGWCQQREEDGMHMVAREICWGLYYQSQALIVMRLNEGEIEFLDAARFLVPVSDPVGEHVYTGPMNKYCIAAVADMPNPVDDSFDGKKEIVVTTRKGVYFYSYDPDLEIDNKLVYRGSHCTDEGGMHWRTIYSIGPVMADILNTGDLRAIVPRYNGWFGDGWKTQIMILERDGTIHQDWDQIGEAFQGYLWVEGEMPAVADILSDGTPEIIFHLLNENDGDPNFEDTYLYCTQWNRAQINGHWPQRTDDLAFGSIPIAANLHEDDACNIIIANERGGDDILLFEADEDNYQEAWNATHPPDFSVPCVTDLFSDGNLSLLVRSINNGQDEMVIQIIDTDVEIDDDRNELEYVEWSQLMNGPRHDGLYAQVYAGVQPTGNTYWRDRVIVEGTVRVPDDGILTILENTVVEFNQYGNLVIDLGGRLHDVENAVFKPNYEGGEDDEFHISFVRDLMAHDIRFFDGGFLYCEISIEEGHNITFENCTFTGEGEGLGSDIAVVAEDAEVNFIDCTFKGYDIALQLDNCTGSIEGCTFEDAEWYAVELDNCLGGLTIEDCQFHDNGSAAIYLYNSNPDIEGCDI